MIQDLKKGGKFIYIEFSNLNSVGLIFVLTDKNIFLTSKTQYSIGYSTQFTILVSDINNNLYFAEFIDLSLIQ